MDVILFLLHLYYFLKKSLFALLTSLKSMVESIEQVLIQKTAMSCAFLPYGLHFSKGPVMQMQLCPEAYISKLKYQDETLKHLDTIADTVSIKRGLKAAAFIKIIETMINKAAKIIENYVIHSKLFTHTDKSEFFSAQHRILKKIFTLRKVKLSSHLESSSSKDAVKVGPEQLHQRINYQVDLLKHLNGVGTPKCHKVIKTSNNIYIVYDEFPSRNLKQYLLTHIMTKGQSIIISMVELELMLKIAHTITAIHRAGIILNGLNIQTIRVHDSGDILICDLSLSCMAEKPERFNRELISLHEKENFPEEIFTKGKCSYSTDVFMLGCVLGQIITNQLDSHHPKYRIIRKTIEHMTKSKPEDRLSLAESIMEIEAQQNNTISERKGNQINSPVALLAPPTLFNDLKPRKYSMDEYNKERDVSVVPKHGAIIKKMTCEDLTHADLTLRQKKNYSIASGSTNPLTIITSAKNLQLKCPSAVSNRSRSRQSQNYDPKDIQISRKVIKQRNLAFFISGLAYFAIEQQASPELSFLLIKYANLTLRDCLSHFPSADDLSQEANQLKAIIVREKQKIDATQQRMRGILITQASDSFFKRQLEQKSSISDRYLQKKILQFCRQIQSQLQRPSEGRRSVSESTGILFNVYMLLKKVEMGSYQKFWESIYNSNYANLSSQRYMKDEKNLGFRYLRSKVSQILS